ncbi:hypothetical protein EDD29_0127 [Actinocorallia herbida]|uniref:Uncharacterized protein n=1 Tax=Actinocorallia herbida TaxID=58109 RepID=A0A3N1CMU3_9ACTN|nr:hypothetical protein [Actinocorallia herbida]ROO82646.1 hypothetical protein EDD29_0127 [Actinocorallia herbida]
MTTPTPRGQSRTITCKHCRKPAENAGHGYCSADYQRWTDAGQPPEGPAPARHGRDARRNAYLAARLRGLNVHDAAAAVNISTRTGYRYEHALATQLKATA